LEEKEYSELLERVLSSTPPQRPSRRLEVPLVQSFNEGMKTMINNLDKIAQILMRDRDHLLKYMVKRLATSGSRVDEKIIQKGKFKKDQLNAVVEEYMKDYVFCPVCNQPDTALTKEKGIQYLVCSSCGARVAVRKV
jgi:translation initiation factor 2 subunit 2